MLWGRYASRASEARYPQLWQGRVFGLCPSVQGPAGLNVYDLSGRGRHGTLNNMAPPTDWVRANGQYALDMDGSNDFVQFPSVTTSGQQTVAIHVSLSTASIIVGGGSNTYALYTDGLTSGGRLYYSVSGIFVSVIHGGLASQWAHLAVVRNGASIQFFKNGVQLGATQTLAAGVGSQSLLYVGREGGGYYGSMQWDDLAIYNRALTAGEIRLLATRRGIAYEARRDIVFGSTANRRRRILTGMV